MSSAKAALHDTQIVFRDEFTSLGRDQDTKVSRARSRYGSNGNGEAVTSHKAATRDPASGHAAGSKPLSDLDIDRDQSKPVAGVPAEVLKEAVSSALALLRQSAGPHALVRLLQRLRSGCSPHADGSAFEEWRATAGVPLEEAHLHALFRGADPHCTGYLQEDRLLDLLAPTAPGPRLQLAEAAVQGVLQQCPRDGSQGRPTLGAVLGCFRAKGFLAAAGWDLAQQGRGGAAAGGWRSAEEGVQEVVGFFGCNLQDGVEAARLLQYFRCLSAAVDSDEAFSALLAQSWRLQPSNPLPTTPLTSWTNPMYAAASPTPPRRRNPITHDLPPPHARPPQQAPVADTPDTTPTTPPPPASPQGLPHRSNSPTPCTTPRTPSTPASLPRSPLPNPPAVRTSPQPHASSPPRTRTPSPAPTPSSPPPSHLSSPHGTPPLTTTTSPPHSPRSSSPASHRSPSPPPNTMALLHSPRSSPAAPNPSTTPPHPPAAPSARPAALAPAAAPSRTHAAGVRTEGYPSPSRRSRSSTMTYSSFTFG